MTFKNLTFAEVPTNAGRDPILTRRQKLIERLEEQISLAKNPDFATKVKRWVKDDQSNRKLTETTKRISPWWVTDQKGEVYLSVKSGLKRIEFEKGKTAIKVGALSKLESVLQALVEATSLGRWIISSLRLRRHSPQKRNDQIPSDRRSRRLCDYPPGV